MCVRGVSRARKAQLCEAIVTLARADMDWHDERWLVEGRIKLQSGGDSDDDDGEGDVRSLEGSGAAARDAYVDEELEPEGERLPATETLEPTWHEEAGDCLLAEFQREAQRRLDEVFCNGAGRTPRAGILHMPTGAGKTRTTVDWLLKRFVGHGKRVLWIAHRLELLDQAHHAVRQWAYQARRPFRVSRIDGRHGKHFDGDFLIASIQSVLNEPWGSFRRAGRGEIAIVVWDEAHRAAARTWFRRCRVYKQKAHLLGLTATPFRSNEKESKKLLDLFGAQGGDGDPFVYRVSFADLIAQGFLAKPDLTDYYVRTAVHLDNRSLEELKRQKEFTARVLRAYAKSDERTREIVEYWVKRRQQYGQTVAFACTIEHAEAMANAFRKRGVEAWAVHSRLERDERERRLKAYARLQGRAGVLVNVGLLTEGWDVPSTRTVLMARPTASTVLYEQMIGRGARGPLACPGKKTFWIVDCVDNVEKHGIELAGRRVFEQLRWACAEASEAQAVTVGGPIEIEDEQATIEEWLDAGAIDPTDLALDALEFVVCEQHWWGVLRWRTALGHVRMLPVFEESYPLLRAACDLLANRLEGRGCDEELDAMAVELAEQRAMRLGDWDDLVADVRKTERAPELLPLKIKRTVGLSAEVRRKAEVYRFAFEEAKRLRAEGLTSAVAAAIDAAGKAIEKARLSSAEQRQLQLDLRSLSTWLAGQFETRERERVRVEEARSRAASLQTPERERFECEQTHTVALALAAASGAGDADPRMVAKGSRGAGRGGRFARGGDRGDQAISAAGSRPGGEGARARARRDGRGVGGARAVGRSFVCRVGHGRGECGRVACAAGEKAARRKRAGERHGGLDLHVVQRVAQSGLSLLPALRYAARRADEGNRVSARRGGCSVGANQHAAAGLSGSGIAQAVRASRQQARQSGSYLSAPPISIRASPPAMRLVRVAASLAPQRAQTALRWTIASASASS